jgi:hypothetical protein
MFYDFGSEKGWMENSYHVVMQGEIRNSRASNSFTTIALDSKVLLKLRKDVLIVVCFDGAKNLSLPIFVGRNQKSSLLLDIFFQKSGMPMSLSPFLYLRMP